MKTKNRNSLVLAAVFVLVTGLLGAEEPPVTLNFYFPVAVGGPITKVVDGLCADFTKANPGIQINAVYSGSYADTMIKVQTGVKGHNPPDLAVLQATELHTLLDLGALEPLDGTQADFYPAFLENSQAGGHLWSLPFQRSTIVLYYNKDLFKAAGLDPEKAPKTWKELADDAQKLTKKDASGTVTTWGLEIPGTDFQYWMFQALCIQNGSQLMNADGTKVFLNKPENLEALTYWINLNKVQHAVPEGVVAWATAPTDFLQSKTAMVFHTTGNLTNIRKNAKFPFGVAFLPGNKTFGSPTGGGNLYLFKDINDQKKAAARKFLAWVTAPDQVAAWSEATGYVATRPSAFDTPALKAYVKDFPQAAVARDQLKYAKAELSTHGNSQVYKIVNDNVQAALLGTKTPVQALDDAQAAAEKVLADYQN